MWDIFGERMLRSDATGIDAGGFTGFREGIVARVEVFALFEMLGKVVGFGGKLAVEAKEALLVRGEGLEVLCQW